MNTEVSQPERHPCQLLVEEFSELMQTKRRWLASNRKGMSAAKADRIGQRMNKIRREYFAQLPRLSLSRCPICGEAVTCHFDPFGIAGFWWQKRELTVELEPPTACRHFGLLQGAVHLNGLPPQGGFAPALTGPEIPFWAPRVLSHPATQLVVSQVPMACGYTAYPLVYFSETPLPASHQMETWRMDTYTVSSRASSGWSISQAPWEFDLTRPIEEGKIGWIAEPCGLQESVGEPRFGLFSEYPLRGLEGRQSRLSILEDQVQERPLPQGVSQHPFD